MAGERHPREPRDSRRSTPITLHVRAWNERGGPVNPSREVMRAMHAMVRAELSVRRLWRTPPAYLGFPDHRAWHDPRALGELTCDAYADAILRRLRSLRPRVDAGQVIEPLIRRNVGYFFTECQQRHDPVGYKTHAAVENAVRLMAASGRATIEPMAVDTMILFPSNKAATPVGPDELAGVLDGWSERRLLVERLASKAAAVTGLMTAALEHLEARSVGALRQGHLVRTLARAARPLAGHHAHEALADTDADDEVLAAMMAVPPDLRREQRRDLQALRRSFEGAVDEYPIAKGADRTILRAIVADWFEHAEPPAADGASLRAWTFPRQSEVSERTGYPRQRVSEAFKVLTEIAEWAFLSDEVPDGAHGDLLEGAGANAEVDR